MAYLRIKLIRVSQYELTHGEFLSATSLAISAGAGGSGCAVLPTFILAGLVLGIAGNPAGGKSDPPVCEVGREIPGRDG